MTQETKSRIAAMRFQGYSYRNIATELGMPLDTVKTHCRRNYLTSVAIRPDSQCAGLQQSSKEEKPVAQKSIRRPECIIKRCFAEKPDETAVADVVRMLLGW